MTGLTRHELERDTKAVRSLERIAAATERIATALERLVEPDEGSPEVAE